MSTTLTLTVTTTTAIAAFTSRPQAPPPPPPTSSPPTPLLALLASTWRFWASILRILLAPMTAILSQLRLLAYFLVRLVKSCIPPMAIYTFFSTAVVAGLSTGAAIALLAFLCIPPRRRTVQEEMRERAMRRRRRGIQGGGYRGRDKAGFGIGGRSVGLGPGGYIAEGTVAGGYSPRDAARRRIVFEPIFEEEDEDDEVEWVR